MVNRNVGGFAVPVQHSRIGSFVTALITMIIHTIAPASGKVKRVKAKHYAKEGMYSTCLATKCNKKYDELQIRIGKERVKKKIYYKMQDEY
jgi:hypothetical protein